MVAKPLPKPPGKRQSSDSGVEPDRGALLQERDQRPGLSQEKKDQRIAPFVSDFDHQDKEHVQETKEELDSPLQTAEKAFAVELLTMPAASRKMKRKDLLNLQGGEEVALTAAVVSVCFQILSQFTE
ncbi:borealin-2-like [Pipra filicauda]|uniref:Borealin-2-like n=1 Tax=Pipra filicauda TaxID=649802 RepID=A0A7R5KGN6_9PASS|nr:borealin-2-like [Pipra filicauda]